MQTVFVPVSEDDQYDGAYISNDGQSLCRLKETQAVLFTKDDADRISKETVILHLRFREAQAQFIDCVLDPQKTFGEVLSYTKQKEQNAILYEIVFKNAYSVYLFAHAQASVLPGNGFNISTLLRTTRGITPDDLAQLDHHETGETSN